MNEENGHTKTAKGPATLVNFLREVPFIDISKNFGMYVIVLDVLLV